MERRNFFKNIFCAGVVLAVAPQTLLSNEQPIVKETSKQLAGSEFKAFKKVVAVLKKDGEIVAYCTGHVQLSTSVELLDITTQDDVMNFRPLQVRPGRQSMMITIPNIVFTKKEKDFAELSDNALEFVMENEEFRLHAENVWLTNLEMTHSFDASITWKANLRLSGKMTTEPLK